MDGAVREVNRKWFVYTRVQRERMTTIAQIFVAPFVSPAFVGTGKFALLPVGFVDRGELVLLVRFVGLGELVLPLVGVVGSGRSISLTGSVGPGESVVLVEIVGSGEFEGTGGLGGPDGTLMLVTFPWE